MINPWTHRRILKKGTPGRATIVAASVPARGASSFNMAMTLQVYVEGRVPYEVEDQWMVKARDTEALHGSIPVRVDPKDPNRVAIDWATLRSEHAAAEDHRRAALAAQGPVGDPDTAAAMGLLDSLGLGDLARSGGATVTVGEPITISDAQVDARAGGDDDLVSGLERLTALRDAGALTPEEFATAKDRLLDGG